MSKFTLDRDKNYKENEKLCLKQLSWTFFISRNQLYIRLQVKTSTLLGPVNTATTL
jgi:hypothetical protein